MTADLRRAGGSLVLLTLPDGQRRYAVVRRPRQERDGSWWYELQIHLPAQAENDLRSPSRDVACASELARRHAPDYPAPVKARA